MTRLFAGMMRLTLATVVAGCLCAGGCGGESFRPRLGRPAPRGIEAFERQFGTNRALPPQRSRRVSVLVMLPAYGVVEQIRRGNMGHAAIDVGGRLYDVGSLNGYAYTVRGSPAVRFWDFADADAAVGALADQADTNGHLDRITRFDVTVTDEQANRLHERRLLLGVRGRSDDQVVNQGKPRRAHLRPNSSASRTPAPAA
jgi:hypothetical protein